MSRLKKLREYVNNELNRMDDADKHISAVAHLYGVSLAASGDTSRSHSARSC